MALVCCIQCIQALPDELVFSAADQHLLHTDAEVSCRGEGIQYNFSCTYTSKWLVVYTNIVTDFFLGEELCETSRLNCQAAVTKETASCTAAVQYICTVCIYAEIVSHLWMLPGCWGRRVSSQTCRAVSDTF